ncbi:MULTISPECIES: PolC-type DNA polymerase III [Endozoicomonas]|uniref:3'-5' exonuclease n=1 Tax=Endozoicomonas TaxID=305899 RepID=UPI0008241C20|nr:3'-5' exonuclease [Endozoicomonas atrinae]
MGHKKADTVVVLDLETTGFSPRKGDRTIEVGAVLIEHGTVTDHFQGLMNPGFPVSEFISDYTGITNAMLENAPSCSEVIGELARFIGSHNLVAHNAPFDQRFLDNEMGLAGTTYSGEFACSLEAARWVYPNAPDHRLSTLVDYKHLPTDGTYHRALSDARMTAHLWLAMLNDLSRIRHSTPIAFSDMQCLRAVMEY